MQVIVIRLDYLDDLAGESRYARHPWLDYQDLVRR
jgi:hypothetical protein